MAARTDRVSVLDFETTGLSPVQGDRPTEVAIAVVEGDRIVDRYQSLMNPGRRIPPQIMWLTGITDAMVARAPEVAHVMREEAAFVGGCRWWRTTWLSPACCCWPGCPHEAPVSWLQRIDTLVDLAVPAAVRLSRRVVRCISRRPSHRSLRPASVIPMCGPTGHLHPLTTAPERGS
jgi:hypothetical protein